MPISKEQFVTRLYEEGDFKVNDIKLTVEGAIPKVLEDEVKKWEDDARVQFYIRWWVYDLIEIDDVIAQTVRKAYSIPDATMERIFRDG